MSQARVFTIGHSTHPIERFIALLKQHSVTAVADVRSSPYSRFNPQFNRETLERTLKESGIAYVFLGRELGARSQDSACYENGKVQYGRLAKTEAFRAGIERVRQGSESHHIALMCAEKEPLDCHRTLLVSRALESTGTPVMHILADGREEPHPDTMKRLIQMLGLLGNDMFPEELIDEAYLLQERRIAYVDEQLANEAGKVES